MRVLIVGLGVIGGSYARGLCQKHEVLGYDISNETLQYALDNKWISKTGNLEDLIKEASVIVLSIYPKNVIGFIETHKNAFHDGQIITDVTGVKGSFIYRVKEVLPPNVEFIGAHPMAGKEKKGIMFADENVFKRANFIITKTDDNSEAGIDVIKGLAQDLGFARITIITPEYHDQVIAFTSQLTHAIAVSLVNSDDDENTPLFTGDSYRDLTRIAKINEDLWAELFLENKENLLHQMDKFTKQFDELKALIINDDYDGLKKAFIKSTEKRGRFDEKNTR